MSNEGCELFDNALRPKTLKEYVGQARVKKLLQVSIEAAKFRNEPMDHILFIGPPGLGKTSLAQAVAHELGVRIKVVNAPSISGAKSISGILQSLKAKDILFIDEIHRLSKSMEELLHHPMEDHLLTIEVETEEGIEMVEVKLPPFTLMGATTRSSMIAAPLLDRFGHKYHLDYYTSQELVQIIQRSAEKLKVKIDNAAALVIAARSRKTPRNANRILKTVRDYAHSKRVTSINRETAVAACKLLGIDHYGFDEMDRRILKTIAGKFEGGPVGLETLSYAVGEEADTIRDIYEPYLLQEGFLQRTGRGRIVTSRGYESLDMKTILR